MAQYDMMSRIKGVVRRTIEGRIGDEDHVEWSLTLVPIYSECDHGEVGFEFALGLSARVHFPESETTMVYNLLSSLPSRPINAENDAISGWINSWWDEVTMDRLEAQMEAEHEPDAPSNEGP